MKRLLLPLFALILLFSGCVREIITVPEPSENFYVLDSAGVLDISTENRIVRINADLDKKCGAQIAVVCIDTTGNIDIADYSLCLFEKWGIGDSKKRNGVLVLISVKDSNYWLLQGNGIEEELPSGILKLMAGKYLEPKFAEGDIDGAVNDIFDALIDHFEAMYSITVEMQSSAHPVWNFGTVEGFFSPIIGLVKGIVDSLGGFTVAIIIIIVLACIFSSAPSGKRGQFFIYSTRSATRAGRPNYSGYKPGRYPSGHSFSSGKSGFSADRHSGGGGSSRGGGSGRR